jgi:hypothetical protein
MQDRRKMGALKTLANTRKPLSLKVFSVFLVSAVIGYFLQFPTTHGHKTGTNRYCKYRGRLSGRPFRLMNESRYRYAIYDPIK